MDKMKIMKKKNKVLETIKDVTTFILVVLGIDHAFDIINPELCWLFWAM